MGLSEEKLVEVVDGLYERSGGNTNFRKWFKIIKPKNYIHLTKYLVWKEKGFCPSRMSISKRQNLIKKSSLFLS